MEKNNDITSIGNKISEIRLSKGISIRKLSKIIGITDTALAKIESGSTKSITINLGKGIAQALGISFNELFEIEATTKNSLIEELKEENERLKNQQLIQSKLIDSYEREIKINNDHLITWPEYYILGFLTELRNDFNKELIDENEAIARTNTVFNIVAMAFLFSTRFEMEFIDNLERRLKNKYEFIYDIDFKPFIEMVREIKRDYDKEN